VKKHKSDSDLFLKYLPLRFYERLPDLTRDELDNPSPETARKAKLLLAAHNDLPQALKNLEKLVSMGDVEPAVEATIALTTEFEAKVVKLRQRFEQSRRAHKPRRQDLTDAIARAKQKYPGALKSMTARAVLKDLNDRGVDPLPDRRTVYRRLAKFSGA
jgi:hypothetical protein